MKELLTSKSQEYYTPVEAILPILPYIKNFKKVWCPFDTVESNYVKVLREYGHEVVYSHIEEGENFFLTEPKDCDIIISNPPFKQKTEIFEKLFQLGKPFMILISNLSILDTTKRWELFTKNPFEIMVFDKRVRYFLDYGNQEEYTNPPFNSWYVCSKVLPEKIIFERLDRQ